MRKADTLLTVSDGDSLTLRSLAGVPVWPVASLRCVVARYQVVMCALC